MWAHLQAGHFASYMPSMPINAMKRYLSTIRVIMGNSLSMSKHVANLGMNDLETKPRPFSIVKLPNNSKYT